MYTPSHFEESRWPVLHELMQRHPFAAIVANTSGGLEANHVPLILDAGRGASGTLRGHIARANGMWQQVPAGTEVLVIFQGVNHYISPRWYPSKKEHGKVVPTWNYAIVHAHGRIEWFHDRAWLRALLETTTNHHESGQPAPWHVSDAPEEYVQRMLGAIVGFEIPIDRIAGKWKLSQNRSEADRAGVVSGLSAHAEASAREMAALIERSGPKNGHRG
jgi:transcriptional regulator